MRVEVKVTSKNKFAPVANATVQEVQNALYLVAEEIMTDAKLHYVPVVSGNLRNSGFVNKPTITGNDVSVDIGFGGAAVAYAAAVHEYPASYGKGKNKYLSKPIAAATPTLANRIAAFLKAAQRSVQQKVGV